MLVTRIYETEYQARDAAQEILDSGFPEDRIQLVTAGSSESGSSGDSVASALRAGHALRKVDPSVYAGALQKGRSLVVVNAFYGSSSEICRLLDKFDPVDRDLSVNGQESAPLSAWFGLPVLSSTAMPLSNYLELPSLSSGRSFMSRMFGETSSFTLSSMLGMRMLSDNAAPLSSKFGMRTLSSDDSPGEKSFGVSLLSDNSMPLSSKIGMTQLSDNPTPLSSMFGLRVLSKTED